MNYLQYNKIDCFVCIALAPGHPETPNGTAASIQYRIGALYILWGALATFISLVPKVHGTLNFTASGHCQYFSAVSTFERELLSLGGNMLLLVYQNRATLY